MVTNTFNVIPATGTKMVFPNDVYKSTGSTVTKDGLNSTFTLATTGVYKVTVICQGASWSASGSDSWELVKDGLSAILSFTVRSNNAGSTAMSKEIGTVFVTSTGTTKLTWERISNSVLTQIEFALIFEELY
jgi:hypothetical protein